MSTRELSAAASKRLDRAYAIEHLLTHYIKEGQTVYTIIKSVSSSGMSRDITLKVVNDGKLEDITYYAAQALEWRLVERNGSRAVRVGGCGMDMGFHTVYTLARVLFRGSVEGDAGYSLRQEWA